MTYRASRPGVARDSFFSADPSEIQQFLSERFTDVVALEPVGGAAVECGYETTAADAFVVGHMWTTVATEWHIDEMEDTVLVQHLRDGSLTHSAAAFREVRTGAGDTVLSPPVGEFRTSAEAFDMDIVALDTAEVTRFAECVHGIAGTDLGFADLSPLTSSRHRHWDATVTRVRDEVLGNPVLSDSAIALDAAFQYLATAFLATFPTAVSASADVRRTRRRVPEAALREVREYLRAHAGEPVGPAEIAAVGGAPAAVVAEQMSRRHDVHPGRILWDSRLVGARRDLCDADPTVTDVETVAARWGFVRPDGFRLAYARTFGETPDDTLRR